MRCISIALVLVGFAALAAAQDKSVNPGINKPFEKPNAQEFVERFERDGRDPYDHREGVLKACGLKPGMIVADIGAGTGLFTRMFASAVGPEGRVYAVDIAEEFVKHVERTAQSEGLKNVKGVVCKADAVNLPSQAIDLAFICDTYHHFEFPHKTMRSIHEALKPGGVVILIDFQRIEGVSSEWVLSHVRAGQEVFTKEILDAGFKQIEEKKGILKESYFLRFEKVEPPKTEKPLVPLPKKAPEPADNPSTLQKVELGKQLFFDPRLSGDNQTSCASCHAPDKAWGDGLPTSKGIGGKPLARNSQTVLNTGFFKSLFWDGRAASLEEQALAPLRSPEEMKQDLAELEQELNAIPGYVRQFEAVFGKKPDREGVAKALAAFQRTLVTGPSPFDRYLAGDKSALTQDAVRGLELFQGDAGCIRCHQGPLLSDGQYYRLNVGRQDEGRGKITIQAEDRARFRTPSLRNIAETGPYMHDGSLATLDDVVTLYYRGIVSSAGSGPADAEALLSQSFSDIPLIVEFLRSLSGTMPELELPLLPSVLKGQDETLVSPARIADHGVRDHLIVSPYQRGQTQIRVLLPENLDEGQRYPVVYVLPVEPGVEARFGDGLAEVLKHDLHNKHRAIFVAPTFSALPWYADHPTNKELRQETYFLHVVVPLIEKMYPAQTTTSGRRLLGFSKSGWGAWSLLLRHPNVFGRAVAWDAPMLLDAPGKYGSGEIFGTPANFEKYRVVQLLRGSRLEDNRLILLGRGNFQREHEQVHELMTNLNVSHVYREGQQRKHDWHSGWVAEAVELLLED